MKPKQEYVADTASDALEAMFRGLELSEDNKVRAVAYHQLSTQSELSESGLFFSGHFWELAQEDKQLAAALSFIDKLHSPCLEGEALLANDKDMRTYLSEHIAFLVDEKLKQRRGVLEPLAEEHPPVTLFCPDGSGMVRPNPLKSDYMRIDEQTVCERCKQTFAEHTKSYSLKRPVPRVPSGRPTSSHQDAQ